MFFQNREEAGRLLARALAEYQGADAVVYALPRGGVILGAEVAKALSLPLDLLIARKIGHPINPEYAICALSQSGHLICNEEERASVDAHWLEQAVEAERREAERRRQRYLGDRPPIPANGKIAILVDDGIATGLTMRAAIRDIQAQHPRKIVVAIPVIPRETAEFLRREVDQVVALDIPDLFLGAVGAYYKDFHPVTDEEVVRLLQSDPPLCFAFPAYQPLADALSLSAGEWAPARFPNGEIQIRLATPVPTDGCMLLGTLTPPDEQLLTTLLLADTLRKEGATVVTALIPYLAYMRQDKVEPGKSRATPWVGRLLAASGISGIITVDIHSRTAVEQLAVPVRSLSPAPLFAEEILALALQDATLVAPDQGAIRRCEEVREAVGMAQPIAHMRKERLPEGIRAALEGEVGRSAVIIDDMLDTGGTLIACCRALRDAGVSSIIVMVTHGLFTGASWQKLWELGVSRIYCTDTVPNPPRDERIRVLSIVPILAPALSGT